MCVEPHIIADVLVSRGLSRMIGNNLVRFLGEEDTATYASLPDTDTVGESVTNARTKVLQLKAATTD
ncbi:MAG: hypothetical protein V7K67_12515 [Nostoc sp.]|uniref:hypothetical protein n=1 Tax=Nostoc sp. TaxID=1180 RepID=UPI002FF20A81